jgi:hypothetical protein
LPPAPIPCLQNKQGAKAKGLTAQESAAKIEAMRRTAAKLFSARPKDFSFALRFSWDGASGHTAAEQDLSILAEQIVHPPAHSPDLQRPVESPHSVIHKEFNKRLCADRRIKTVSAAIQLLKQVVKDKVDVEHIRPLIDRLPETYMDIVEAHGNWAQRRHR